MIKVFGDGLDALVAINLLLKSGQQVVHFSNTERPGGHFGGTDSCGGKFDLGMVLLEPDFIAGQSRPIEDYEGEFGRASRVFLENVFSWLSSQVGGFVDHSVMTRLNSDELVPDYFIADNLDFLKTLNDKSRSELKSRLVSRIEQAPRGHLGHPSEKLTSKIASDTLLSDLLQQVFGAELYERLFEGFLGKISGDTRPLISSRDNRRVWMPNYYPESLLFSLTHDQMYAGFELQPLKFLRPAHFQIADFINKLHGENLKHENFQSEKASGSGQDHNYSRPDEIYFVSLGDFKAQESESFEIRELTSKLGKKADFIVSNTINLTHFCVSDCESKTVFVPEKGDHIMRYSYYASSERNSVSIESTSGLHDSKALSLNLLDKDGLRPVCQGISKEVPLRLRETEFSIKEWENLTLAVKEKYESLNRSFFLIHPEANSFNDNLLRGLAAIRKRELNAS